MLDPAADVIDRGVRQLAHVEVVQHERGVGQADLLVEQRGPVGGGRVERSDANPGPPLRGLRGQPGPEHLLGASLDDVERSAAGQVHDHGHEPAAPATRGTVHHLLVHPDRHTQPGLAGVELLVGEQPGGGVLDRPHHRLPADPELPCHRRDRTAELTDLAGRLGPRTLGQHRPRQDVGMLLAPGAVAVPAAPLPLVPHEPGGLRADREVPDLDDVPAARDGPLPAAAAGVAVADGLDEHVPLIDELEHAEHPQPGDPEQRHRRRRR